jgi:hypothetical protein
MKRAFSGDILFGLLLVLTAALLCLPSQVIACSGAPSPQLIVMWNDNGTYPPPEVGANPAAKVRIYIVDEDTPAKFDVFWDTGGVSSIQISDSNSYSVGTVDPGGWWTDNGGGILVPLDQLAALLGGATAMQMINDDELIFCSEAPAYFSKVDFDNEDAIRQGVYCIDNGDSDSNNSDWRGGQTGYANVGTYPASTNANTAIADIFGTPFDFRNCPIEFRDLVIAGEDGESETSDDRCRILRTVLPFCDYTDPYTVPSDSSDNFCSFVPDGLGSAVLNDTNYEWWEPGDSVPPTGTTSYNRMVTVGTKYTGDPKWRYLGMGVELDMDSTDLVDVPNEKATGSMASASVTCSFTMPTAPFLLMTKVSATFLFYLNDTDPNKGVDFEWYEIKQTYDGVLNKWTPSGLPTVSGDNTELDETAVDTMRTDGTCFGPFHTEVKGYWLRPNENPAAQSITLVGVRDKTPPQHVVYRVGDKYSTTPPTLNAKTGDSIAQNSSNPEFVEVTLIDNNPYTAYDLMFNDLNLTSDIVNRDDFFPNSSKNLSCKVIYSTEMYDYSKVSNEDTELGSDKDKNAYQMTANLYNKRLVWAESVFGDTSNPRALMDFASDGSDGIEYDIFDADCNSIKADILPRIATINEMVISGADGAGGTYTNPLYVPPNGGGRNTSIPPAVVPTISEDYPNLQMLRPSPSGFQPAFSTVTFKVPLSAFAEAMPLHDTYSSGSSTLKWFPLLCDASGNVAPGCEDSDPPLAKNSDITGFAQFMTNGDNYASASGTEILAADGNPGYDGPDQNPYGNLVVAAGTSAMMPTPVGGTVGTELIRDVSSGSWSQIFNGNVPLPGELSGMGEIVVEDDEPPQVFVYVTDTKYDKTYRFGLQRDGDGLRDAMMGSADGWCNKSTTLGSSSDQMGSNLNYGLRGYDLVAKEADFFRDDILFAGNNGWTSYQDYYSAIQADTFDPSAAFDGTSASLPNLPGCWVDEDTRLLFRVVAYDNCNTYKKGTNVNPGTSDLMSVFEKKEPNASASELGNGISSVEWTIIDNGSTVPNSQNYANDYVFRNPSVDSSFALDDSKECSVQVEVKDAAMNTRILKIRFYVVGNDMQFKSIEEKSGRGSQGSWF